MNLAEHHIETVFRLLQYDQVCRNITLRGSDQVNIQANNLWMFSSLIRALIGTSVSANEEALILLPDYHGNDIIAALNILNTSQNDDIMFSEIIKNVLDDFGVDLNNTEQLQLDKEINMRESKEVIRSNLIDEIINNKTVKEVVCYYCSKSFTGQRAKDKYRNHLGQSHFLSEMKEEIGKYFDTNDKCTECGKTYVTASFKRKHLTKHHSYLVDKILKLVNRKENEPFLEQSIIEVRNPEDIDTGADEPIGQSLENLFTELGNKCSSVTNVTGEDLEITRIIDEYPEINRINDEHDKRCYTLR